MGAKEQKIIQHILKTLPINQRLFRINAGLGWIGQIINVQRDRNIITIKDARPFHGAPQGWPDLVGWEEIEITPDMVGQRISRFLAVEVKATGKLTKDQKRLKKIIEGMGGRFEVISKLGPRSQQPQPKSQHKERSLLSD